MFTSKPEDKRWTHSCWVFSLGHPDTETALGIQPWTHGANSTVRPETYKCEEDPELHASGSYLCTVV